MSKKHKNKKRGKKIKAFIFEQGVLVVKRDGKIHRFLDTHPANKQ